MDVAIRVREIIAHSLMLPVDAVRPEADIATDLAAHSLDLVDILLDAEDAFGISIPDEDAELIRTVQDAIDYIERRIGGEI